MMGGPHSAGSNPCCNHLLFGVVPASVKAMRRGDFIKVIVGSAAAWPLAALAQQPAVPVVGFLSGSSLKSVFNEITAFQDGLKEAGFLDGRNVRIEYRWAEQHYDQLPALANELVAHRVAVIAATGGTASVLAAKATTLTIPIVFVTGGDPVQQGIVASLNQPGGNSTGVSCLGNMLQDTARIDSECRFVCRACKSRQSKF